MRSRDAEVDKDDDGGNRKTIADDREEPGIAGIALEDKPAVGAALSVLRPAMKERPSTAVGTSFAPPAAESRPNHC